MDAPNPRHYSPAHIAKVFFIYLVLWAIVWGLVLGFFMDVGGLVPFLVILGVSAFVSTVSHVVQGRRTVVDSMADQPPITKT